MDYPFVIDRVLHNPGGIQEWGKCYHLHVWGDGISCKWECYIDEIRIKI